METLTHGQLGLWIACLVTFVTSILALGGAYRALTRNFVTKPELTVALSALEKQIEKDITDTRHLLRNEMGTRFLKIDEKLEIMHEGQTKARETLARIETRLEFVAPISQRDAGPS